MIHGFNRVLVTVDNQAWALNATATRPQKVKNNNKNGLSCLAAPLIGKGSESLGIIRISKRNVIWKNSHKNFLNIKKR